LVLPNELIPLVSLCAALMAGCWILSLIFREYSWVDRIWSIAPPIYVAMLAHAAGWADARLDGMALLTALWGARLTFNYARKGGYAPGGEDYRWSILKARMSPVAWHLFNLGFIADYQNLLILLFSLPAWMAYRHQAPTGAADLLLGAAFLALLIGETIADQQQWTFQQEKQARKARGEPGPEFVTGGLWRYTRHPNFFCEVSQWWVIYLIPVAGGAPPLNVTIAGPILLTLLFLGSTKFTEQITLSRYPSYAAYQKSTSMLLPWFPASGQDREQHG
jgi:steroid 5-alpha reductase family enzyme